VGEIDMALRRAGKGYALAVSGAHQVRSCGVMPRVFDTADPIACACLGELLLV
jgi:hypothetical protein